MTNKLCKLTLISVLMLSLSACSSRSAEEVACNFASGVTERQYDKDDYDDSSFADDVFVGLLNIIFQSAHRGISPNTYDSCVKKDIATCIDSKGDVKKECTLTR